MPFLRAALLPNRKPSVERAKPERIIRTREELLIAQAAKAWIALDDLMTKSELARLGY